MAVPAGRLAEVAAVFLKLGVIAFGGPVVHVNLMRREVVDRRRWLGEREFMDMFAASNMVPGPSSTQLAIFLGYRRAGWPALLLAGSLFILPAALIMTALAWAYVAAGSRLEAQAVLSGIRPVVVGIIAWAAVDLGRRIVRRPAPALLALGACALLLLGQDAIVLLLVGGLVMAAGSQLARGRPRPAPGLALLIGSAPAIAPLAALLVTFVKIGALSFGSGYVLLPLLHAEVVEGTGWLTDRQLADAIAIGQATPGPVFTTATFIGYLVAGPAGAALATFGIFLPGFVLVPFLDRLVGWLRPRAWAREFLHGANAAAIGLIVAAMLQLGRVAVVDPVTAALAVLTFAACLRWPLAAPLYVVAGGAVGLALTWLP